jgi:hypothetical protein
MIDADKERFQRVYTNLLVGLAPSDEKLVGAPVYFDSLRALPFEYVEQAGRNILSRPGQHWMPATGEWVELASQLEREAEIAKTANALSAGSAEDAPTYYCNQCEDTSWRYNKDHFDNASGLMVSSVSRCPCQLSNPVLAAKRVRALDRVQGRTQ